jgi:hypothetical protein
MLVFLRHPETSQLVMGLDNVVGLENGSKHGETVAVVELSIVVVAVDSRHFNLLSRLCLVNEIPEKNDLSVAGQSTSGDSARRLLESEFLVVSVDRLLRVEGEGTTRLAALAVADLDLDIGLLLEGSQGLATLGAVKLDILELGENAGSSSNDTTDSYQAV